MSTRWYPVYYRGAPQLRIFLPNFWMKLIRPSEEQPENVVTFAVSMQMTTHDVKNYLEKIYKVPALHVRTRIAMGPTRRDQKYGHVLKDEDVKLAYVTLPREMKFTFPNLFPEKDVEKKNSEKRALEESKEGYKNFLERNKDRPGTPGWFSI